MSKKKTGVRYLKINYHIQYNRTIVCILKSGINLDKMPNIEMLNECPQFAKIIKNYSVEYYNGVPYLTFDTVGIAYCNPFDKFDKNLGKKIAMTRAQTEAFNIACNIYDDICYIWHQIHNNFNRLANNCNHSNNNCYEHSINLAQSK